MIEIKELLKMAVSKKASNLLLGVGLPPLLRINGELIKTEFRPFNINECQNFVFSMLTPKQIEEFVKKNPTPEGERTIAQTLERIYANSEWLKRDKEGIKRFLGKV